MLKQEVKYQDFDDQPATTTLYFNITKTELSQNLHLESKLDAMIDRLSGPERQLTTDEIRDILDMVKDIMKLAYGERRKSDGKDLFVKNDQVWEEFTQSAVYDTFLFSLFQEPQKAIDFMYNVMPADLRDQVKEDMDAREKQGAPVLPAGPPVLESQETDFSAATEASEKKIHEYTRQELLDMPQDQFAKLAGTDVSKMERPILEVAMQRKSQQR